MKFRVIVADCPWPFSDKLKQSNTKRGAVSNYDVMSIDDIKNLDVKSISEDEAVLALWCPSSLIKEGIDVMEAWGFKLKQTNIWIKTKKEPLKSLIRTLALSIVGLDINSINKKTEYKRSVIGITTDILNRCSLDNILSFGMGRLFRQTHEVVLIGTRGSVYRHLKNKSQRSVHFYPATKHSTKPEALQDMLETMFSGNKLEMFARRSRPNWTCVGNECASSLGEDISDSIDRMRKV